MSLKKKIKKTLSYTVLMLLLLLLAAGWWAYAPDIPVDELKQQYATPPSSFMEVQGMPVHYRIEGRGTPLLLLHGTAATLHTWDGWTEQLKNDFAIIRLDLPGFGLTGPHPEASYRLEDYAHFLDEFMQQLGIDNFSLAGNSLGGGIAWYYAATHPEKVEKLILVDPLGIPSDKQPAFIFTLARMSLTAAALKHFTPRAVIAGNLKEVYYDDSKISDSLVERYYLMTRRAGNRQAFVDRARTDNAHDTTLLKQIISPTLILWGEHDEWIPVSDAPIFEKLLPNAALIVYPNAGHVPMEEIPEQTATDTRKFLLTTNK